MSPSEHHSFTRYTPFAVMGLLALAAGSFFTVVNLNQTQDTRSRASGVSEQTSSGNQRLVQKNFQVKQNSTTNSISYTNNVSAGNLLLVGVSHYQGTLTSISDNRGNSYIPINSPKCANLNKDCISLYYVKNAKSGQSTVTVKFSTTTDNNIGVYEYAGYDSSNPLINSVSTSGKSTTPSGGTLTSSQNNQLYFALGVDEYGKNASMNAGSGYTLLHTQNDAASHERYYAEDRISPAGSYATNFSIATISPWVVIGATFKPTITQSPTNTPVSTSTPTPAPVNPPATNTPKHIQSNTNTSDVTSTTINKSFLSNVTAGNLILVAVSWGNSDVATSVTCSDSQGNTYTTAITRKDTTNTQALAVCYAYAGSSFANTVTATFNSNQTTFRRIIISEYSNVAQNGYDVSTGVGGAVATTGTDAVTSGSTNTTYNGELIFGAVNDTTSATTIAAGSGFTQRSSVNGKDLTIQDRIQTNAGPIASTQTFGATHRYDALMVTFKPKITQSPTSTPISTPTPTTKPVIPTPTKTPTPTVSGPTPTKTPTPTVTPTVAPTAAQPTSTPMPTPTIVLGSTNINLALGLHGLGKGGDSANPNGTGNTSPQRPQRTVTVEVYNDANALVKTVTGTVAFDLASGHFKGLIGLGTDVVTGIYQVRVKTDQFLRTLVPGIQSLTNGQTKALPLATLVNGDITNDNLINILDYNILMGCYSDLSPAVNCPAGEEKRADITDDGAVNQFDYNLFLRELINRGGQ